MAVKELHQCSFCNKNQIQVQKLISGNNDVFICDECIELCHDILHREDTSSIAVSDLTPAKIKSYLDEHVIGQDLAKMILSVSIYNHHKRIANPVIEGVEIEKSNLMFIGKSGVGKTHMIQSVAKLLDMPMVIVDATSLTESGYVGLDVEDCISRLYQAAEQDISRTQIGIVFIDEIDKKSRKGENASITRDVSGEGVQQALLKLIEGTECKIPANGGRKNPAGEYVTINTKNILFIVGGAFEGITEIIAKRQSEGSGIGFGASLPFDMAQLKYFEMLKSVQSEDLIKFGIIPELIGRVPVIVPFNELSAEDMVKILNEPKNAILKQYQKLFKLDNIILEFTIEACLAIAELAIQRKTGARGLRSIVEEILMPVQFKLPEMASNNITKIVITPDTVKGESEPILVYQEQPLESKND